MAKIHVTTDDGELINTWSDAGLGDDEIGDLTKRLNGSRLLNEIEGMVGHARKMEGRDVNDGSVHEPDAE